MKLSAAVIAVLLAAGSGCQQGDSFKLFDSFNQALVRQDVARGEQLLADQKPDQASAAFEKAVARDPHNAQAHARLGMILVRSGRIEEAVRHYQLAVRNSPQNAEYALALAQALDGLAETAFDRRQVLEAAARAYAHVRWLDPDNLEAAIRLGDCERRLGRFVEAVQSLHEALRLDPSSARAHVDLAAVYEDLGDADSALSEYSVALKFDPDNIAAHNGCGMINAARDRQDGPRRPSAHERALAHLRKSLQLNPDQPNVRAALEQLDASRGDFADAGGSEP